MDLALQSVHDTISSVDRRLAAGADAPARVWPTGLHPLDTYLSGGFRSGDLILFGGPQGLGKTSMVLQIARNLAVQGRPVLFCSYEHDQESMLARLVSLEAGLTVGEGAADLRRIREAFESPRGGTSLAERLAVVPGGPDALAQISSYADRLNLHRASGRDTDIAALTAAIDEVTARVGTRPFVVIDYLQKVPVPGASGDENERTTTIAEGLKDLALDHDIPVLAIVAADKEGLSAGRRMRATHLRGSTALAYEADTVLLLSSKYDMVSRHHLVYDTTNIDRFRQWAVLTVEKNRSGVTGVDMEFHKRLDQARFDPHGQLVSEQLVEERLYTD